MTFLWSGCADPEPVVPDEETEVTPGEGEEGSGEEGGAACAYPFFST